MKSVMLSPGTLPHYMTNVEDITIPRGAANADVAIAIARKHRGK